MYRVVDTALWTDPKVRSLSPDAKYLFVYLITNGHAHVSGLYYLPSILIAHETGLKPVAINTLFDTLSKGHLVLRDKKMEVVWVVNMLRRQGNGEKIFLAALHHLDTLHDCPLITDFVEHYRELFEKYLKPKDRVSIPYRRGIPQEQEQEQDKKEKNNREPRARLKSRPSKFLPETFQITDALRTWAHTEVPAVDIDHETQCMRDHEFKDAHSDWEKAWRQWMRRAVTYDNGLRSRPKHFHDLPVEEQLAAIERQLHAHE